MVKIYSPYEIEIMKEGGGILAEVMRELKRAAREGMNLFGLNKMAEELIREKGAEPAFLDYKPAGAKHHYQYSICASLNEIIVHGTPYNRILLSGDILKIDFGVKYKGFYTDAAATIGIGAISVESRRLIEATEIALNRAAERCVSGARLGDIGFEIENIAKKFGFKPVVGLTGHGIGRDLHEEPTIYNYGRKGEGIKLRPGMVLAIEPMFSAGSDEIIQLKDESWATKDGSLSAHFEHTVAITSSGPEILTAFNFDVKYYKKMY